MVENLNPTAELFGDVPADQRQRIVSGMRWTLWLSAISFPFSYGTTILLARTSPEAIGTYGLLNVYIGVVMGLFYLGGDPVAIRYIPELNNERRLSFLISYFLIICVATIPWLVVAAIWPEKLHYLLGEGASAAFQLLVLILAPLSILTSLVGAALKGMLEIAWAQTVARLVTIGSFLVYTIFFFAWPSVLSRSYTEVIWGTYLGLSALGAMLGLQRLLHLTAWPGSFRSLRFFLPPRFWQYTLSLQQLSALGFFTQRLDVILVLNFGDLALLGKYVAVVTLAESIRLINRFFVDTLLPSLTNMLATRNLTAASDVFHTHMRILFLVNTASTLGLILLAGPVTALLGAKYTSLSTLVVLLALLVGLSAPSGVGGTLLSSVGKQQRAVWTTLGQVGLYASLFLLLWPRWNLLGAAVAYGVAWVVGNFLLLFIAKHSVPFHFSVTRDYAVFGVIAAAAAFVARRQAFGLATGLLVWAAAIGLFVLFGKYSAAECLRLFKCFFPFQALRRFGRNRQGADAP